MLLTNWGTSWRTANSRSRSRPVSWKRVGLASTSLRCRSLDLNSRNSKELRSSGDVVHRRMLRISYVDRVTNEEILRRVDMERELLKTVEKRQAKFLGYYLRKRKLEDFCLSGKIKGRRASGGQRITFLKNFYPKFGNPHEVWNVARDRDVWKQWFA